MMQPFKKALLKMASPKDKGIICLDITNRCDLKCSNCTRLLQNQTSIWDMTLENFRYALETLRDWPGIIAVIGGNPCAHPQFEELSNIFADIIPERKKRGLWTNNALGKEKIAEEFYGYWNLNTHGVERGLKSLKPISDKYSWPIFTANSDHAPLLTAIKDFGLTDDEMWETISNCEINHGWSAAIVQNNGKLRAYFCEVAASFDLARGEDNGYEVKPGWWLDHVTMFAKQVYHFCPGCGASMNLLPSKDADEIDQFTISNQDLANQSSKKGRINVLVEANKYTGFEKNRHRLTSYSVEHQQNHG
jgi:hypothetical protein